MNQDLVFYDPGLLIDGDLELLVTSHYRGNRVLDYVPAYKFKMVKQGTSEEIGRIDLRLANSEVITQYVGHIGYEVKPFARGKRYAARSVRLILPLARQHNLNPLWITCNPDNFPSRRSCELAGAKYIETVDVPAWHEMYAEGEKQKCRYRIDLGTITQQTTP